MPKITNHKPTVEPLALTTKQVALALGISERSVFNHIATGKLPSVRIGASRRVRVQDLEEFLTQSALQREGDARGIYLDQRDQLNVFAAEWMATEKSKSQEWMQHADESIRLLVNVYRRELSRLLSRRPLTPEWIAMLDAAKPVIARVQKRLKTELSSLPLSDPKTVADRTHTFLITVEQQFASSLGEAKHLHTMQRS
jgi:excisionase family DNA binding protein